MSLGKEALYEMAINDAIEQSANRRGKIMKIINASIDVTKLDKARFIEGKKGTYANLTIFLKDEPDQYENHGFVSQSVDKDEREAGVKLPILGNVRIVWEEEPEREPYTAQKNAVPEGNNVDPNDDIPF